MTTGGHNRITEAFHARLEFIGPIQSLGAETYGRQVVIIPDLMPLGDRWPRGRREIHPEGFFFAD